MPSLEAVAAGLSESHANPNATASDVPEIAFPPLTRDHILNCSYDSWFPRYRTSALKSRIIKLTPDFVKYIGEDGIILADDDETQQDDRPDEEEWASSGASTRQAPDSDSDSDDDEPEADTRPPNERFPEIHQEIKDKIRELGGAVVPKLNWSSPKDAAWISPHQNTLKSTSPNDIYLLLKSSSFVSHDLEHAFDDTVDTSPSTSSQSRPFQPVLVLRPFFSPHPALEFRCFVKHRILIGLCSRDQNHYPFLEALRPALVSKVRSFFDDKLQLTFPDGCFVFDVYVPEDSDARDGLGRVRLIDVNPWAARTDSLLFDWGELLTFDVPRPILGSVVSPHEFREDVGAGADDEDATTEDEDEADELVPELRLMERDNPSSANFSSAQYSAHKLPKEVVDASTAGEGGLREFMQRWRDMTASEGGGDVWESPQQ
ncbi:hypothetical protein D7B24_003790 [Verticillium nonalfalfae]|uniref:Uncharacterized protein n=1 Tax=Verticillium nonalfalfae TaxID=1051616 RepID=A0A3M9YIQ6_9PEZI|nr:uncharacterized protein D7B24_003790 [Verticillium nonalfalfae]RNJ58970.1 hypothetical protein D7B24_003790 [Verticillium nonalfalfae]